MVIIRTGILGGILAEWLAVSEWEINVVPVSRGAGAIKSSPHHISVPWSFLASVLPTAATIYSVEVSRARLPLCVITRRYYD